MPRGQFASYPSRPDGGLPACRGERCHSRGAAAHLGNMTTQPSLPDWLPGWLRLLWEVPGVTDVLINGPREVWLDRGLGLERASTVVQGEWGVQSAGDVRALAVRLASLAGRRLDDASPAVDARLPDGTRLHAVLPPIADGCALLSLRRVRSASMTWEDLIFQGAVHPLLEPVLRGLVRSEVVPHRVRRHRVRQDDLAGDTAGRRRCHGNGSCSSRRRARCVPRTRTW